MYANFTDRIILYGAVWSIHTAILKHRDGVGRKQAEVRAAANPRGWWGPAGWNIKILFSLKKERETNFNWVHVHLPYYLLTPSLRLKKLIRGIIKIVGLARWVKALAAQPDPLSLMLGPAWWKERTISGKLSLTYHIHNK